MVGVQIPTWHWRAREPRPLADVFASVVAGVKVRKKAFGNRLELSEQQDVAMFAHFVRRQRRMRTAKNDRDATAPELARHLVHARPLTILSGDANEVCVVVEVDRLDVLV